MTKPSLQEQAEAYCDDVSASIDCCENCRDKWERETRKHATHAFLAGARAGLDRAAELAEGIYPPSCFYESAGQDWAKSANKAIEDLRIRIAQAIRAEKERV